MNNVEILNYDVLIQKGDLVTEFINRYKSKNTRRNYEAALKDFFQVKKIEHIDKKKIYNIGKMNIQNYILNLIKKGRSSKTINNRIAALKSFYDYIIDFDETINKNPFNGSFVKTLLKINLDKNDNEKVVGKALTKEEVQKLYSVVNNKRDYVLLKLLFVTGARRSEIINIKWEDFYYDKELKKWFLTIRGKGRKYRTISVKNELIKLIKEFHGENPGVIVPMSDGNINRILKKYSKLAGIDVVKAHDCRRTVITRLFHLGVPPIKIQQYVGHSSLSTTLAYIKEIEDKKDNAGDKIDL